jgi:hypothetical protein
MFKPSRLRKDSGSYQGIALAMPQPASFQTPLQGLRRRNRLLAQAAKGLSLALAVSCGAVAAAQSPSLPAGAAQAKVTTACTECHESRIILEQRLSKPAWVKEVDKMVKWGALVDPADRDGFIDYLSANFPSDKPAEPAPRTAAEKKK